MFHLARVLGRAAVPPRGRGGWGHGPYEAWVGAYNFLGET